MPAYNCTFAHFVQERPDAVIGRLTQLNAITGYTSILSTAISAWVKEIELIQTTVQSILDTIASSTDWHLILEFEIPRRQRRPDLIVLAHEIIFVIEFKLGATSFLSESKWQVNDYALDLRDFHLESRDKTIIPLLCATEAPSLESNYQREETIPRKVVLSNASQLAQKLIEVYSKEHSENSNKINPDAWMDAPYRPTPTIVEAAERLFNNHDVREISHSYADNLTSTTDAIVEYVRRAQKEGGRYICFVTGVPGAGKTLTGLNAVHDSRLRANNRPSAVFLSGNGPLVSIVRSALAWSTSKQNAQMSRVEIKRDVETFIQNVHIFLRHHTDHPTEAPHEKVIVFDEAQRAWNSAQMKRKWKIDQSEPELLLEVMERCKGWAVFVALVGGGQEIHRGEAGLAEWGRALAGRRTNWQVIASSEAIDGGASLAGQGLFPIGQPEHLEIEIDPRMHLAVTVRSPRAQRITEWVNALLGRDVEGCMRNLKSISDFPLVMTRNLSRAREWLRARSRSDQFHRSGLVISSGAMRHRAHGLEVSTSFTQGYSYDRWFLSPASDVRSSFMLEVAATEFQCQGLELDWVGVCWGDDLTLSGQNEWNIRQFRGNRWIAIKDEAMRQYIVNKYRVLLTRAREGMVIWVPFGSETDRSRAPEPLDMTYRFLQTVGIPDIGDCS